MPAFLTVAELKTHMYDGAVNLITKNDASIVQSKVDTAIAEAKSYLQRFNIAQLFENVNNDPDYVRDPMLLAHVKNLAKWHLMGLGSVNIDYEDAKTRADEARAWLKDVQSGKSVPDGWPPAADPVKETFFHSTSNPKRNNHI